MQYIWQINNPVLTVKIDSLYSIALATCALFRVSIADLRSESQKQELVDARKSFARQARKEMYNYTLNDIGDFINRDHSTICNYLY